MEITFKNNNLYYYDYKIFNGEITSILVLLIFVIMYFFKHLIKYISYVSIFILIVGNYDAYLKYKKHNLVGILITSILIHMPFLYPLINFKKYFKPNILQFAILIYALLVIQIMPYWPYNLTKNFMSITLVSIYLIILLIYFLIY